jgi:hypothetical protein
LEKQSPNFEKEIGKVGEGVVILFWTNFVHSFIWEKPLEILIFLPIIFANIWKFSPNFKLHDFIFIF